MTTEPDSETNQSFTSPPQTIPIYSNPTLYTILHQIFSDILFPDPNGKYGSSPATDRLKGTLSENIPALKQACSDTGRGVISWAKKGGPLRALLVISVGTIAFLTLSGLAVFMLFFLAATVNAIIISLFVSLAAAGGFLALFFACVATIYVGALCIAAFFISAITISAVVAALIATGWIGFFCVVWLATKKSVGLAKHSVTVTGSALSAYSSSRQARHRPVPDKDSD